MSQFTHHGSLFAAAGVGITRLKPVGHKYSAQNMHSECHEDFPDLKASYTGCRINRPASRNKSPAHTSTLTGVTPSGLRGVQGFHKSWPAQDTAINRGILTQLHWAHVTSRLNCKSTCQMHLKEN